MFGARGLIFIVTNERVYAHDLSLNAFTRFESKENHEGVFSTKRRERSPFNNHTRKRIIGVEK